MTVGELIIKLSAYPPELPVAVDDCGDGWIEVEFATNKEHHNRADWSPMLTVQRQVHHGDFIQIS